MKLGTWVVTHVASEREQRVFFAAAFTADRAREKTFLATGIPAVELNAVLVRTDEGDVPASSRGRLDLERFLGPLTLFSPRRRERCSVCEGQGVVRGALGSPARCAACGGDGLRPEAPRDQTPRSSSR